MASVRTWFDFEQWILQQWMILQTELFHRVVTFLLSVVLLVSEAGRTRRLFF
jgi:hypothetical protein